MNASVLPDVVLLRFEIESWCHYLVIEILKKYFPLKEGNKKRKRDKWEPVFGDKGINCVLTGGLTDCLGKHGYGFVGGWVKEAKKGNLALLLKYSLYPGTVSVDDKIKRGSRKLREFLANGPWEYGQVYMRDELHLVNLVCKIPNPGNVPVCRRLLLDSNGWFTELEVYNVVPSKI